MSSPEPGTEFLCPECAVRLVNALDYSGFDDGGYFHGIAMGCTRCDGLFGKAPNSRIVRIVDEFVPENT
jgi:hypothetical protein